MRNSRAVMFGASSAWVALILVFFVFRGGRTATLVEERRPAPIPSSASLVRQADELAAVGEYEGAAGKYRAALQRQPDDLSLHFALGAALSHVGRQDETVEEFRWVVTRGAPASQEVQVARRWLVSAGVLADRFPFGPAEGAGTAGKVTGKTGWKGAIPEGASRQIRIGLRGTGEANKEVVFDAAVTLGEPYEFREVPPGNYLLTGQIADKTLWEEKVVVEPGETTVLDLTDAPPAVRTATRSNPAAR